MIEKLFALFFEQGKDISSLDILTSAASEVLKASTQDIIDYLKSGENASLILQQDKISKSQGIHGVPNMTISTTRLRRGRVPAPIQLSGAQPPQIYIEAFNELLSS
eukprot:TRINITY_DN1419_c0_g1_i3.p2 TRINITY_DN1419_c0_g1~~TRINITY_DN1419_c0_g1_i3.p2  ORF type:complete len:106 (-),score=10.26 TRINITY_DN1419_c0_g1_i3:282-599(-)